MTMSEGILNSYGYGVQFVRWGESGPKILLLHSMGMDAHSMDLLAGSLQDSHQILSLSILDHGDSDSPKRPLPLDENSEIMRGCYKQFDFYPNVLIGHSIGGMIGMILTAKHPTEFQGLVLVDIAPFESTGRPNRPSPPEFFNNEESARAYIKERYPGFTSEYLNNRMKYCLWRDGDKLKLKPSGSAIRSGMAIDLWPYVTRIKAPTLLLIGEQSTLVTPEIRKRMEGAMQDLKTIVVKGTGHMIPQDKPSEFERIIMGFLKYLQRS